MKKLILSLAVLLVCTLSHADVVEFTDKTVEFDLGSTTYASIYFGKGWRGYSVVLSIKPYSKEIYDSWVAWNSKGQKVGTGLNFISQIDIPMETISFDRDKCKVSMLSSSRSSSVSIRCYDVDESQWVEAKEDFELYNSLVGDFFKKYPAYDWYVQK